MKYNAFDTISMTKKHGFYHNSLYDLKPKRCEKRIERIESVDTTESLSDEK